MQHLFYESRPITFEAMWQDFLALVSVRNDRLWILVARPIQVRSIIIIQTITALGRPVSRLRDLCPMRLNSFLLIMKALCPVFWFQSLVLFVKFQDCGCYRFTSRVKTTRLQYGQLLDHLLGKFLDFIFRSFVNLIKSIIFKWAGLGLLARFILFAFLSRHFT